MNLQNSAFDPLREIQDWYFTKNHELMGIITYDDTGINTPGTAHRVEGIKSVTEFTNDFIVKTSYAVYRLRKSTEKISAAMRVPTSLEFFKRYPL